MSGTFAFFRCKWWVKSEINTPVSTPSKIIVCEFESSRREQDKVSSIRVSALPNSFLLMSLFRESIWYVGGCSAFYFESSCFVTDCVVTILLYTEAGSLNKLLHIKTNDWWREVYWRLLVAIFFRTTERFFIPFKLFILSIITKLCLEILPSDIFLWFANILWVDLLCTRI